MNSPWNQLYDAAKDRRYGNLFFAAFASLFVLLAVAVFIRNEFSDFEAPGVEIGMSIILIGMAILTSIFVRRKTKRDSTSKKCFTTQPMSRDEIIKARSKLVRSKSRG